MLIELCRVGREPELRYTADGKPVCTVSLAYDVGFGENKATQWVAATIWGKRAEALSQKLTKGTLVHVVLSNVASRAYQRRNSDELGSEITGTLFDIKFAGGQRDNEETDRREAPERSEPRGAAARQDSVPQQGSLPDDDIPF